MALYLQRGYQDVTVAKIAAAAGLTKRTFFRYSADKREVLFAGAPANRPAWPQQSWRRPTTLPRSTSSWRHCRRARRSWRQYGQFARARRDLMASSADLRERELIKMVSLTAAVAEALRDRGTNPAQADLTAPAGVTVFTAAYDRWIDTDSASDLPALVQQSLNDLRTAIQPT